MGEYRLEHHQLLMLLLLTPTWNNKNSCVPSKEGDREVNKHLCSRVETLSEQGGKLLHYQTGEVCKARKCIAWRNDVCEASALPLPL